MRLKFRASIYVDLFVDCNENFTSFQNAIDEAREPARREAEILAARIPNAYVGGLATVEELYTNKVQI